MKSAYTATGQQLKDDHINLIKKNDRLVAENERLREALKQCITDVYALGYIKPAKFARMRLDSITELACTALGQ